MPLRLLALVPMLAIGCISQPTPTVITPDPAALPFVRYELANGLDVVLLDDPETSLIAVNLAYHLGTLHDGKHPGLAHLVEHLMFTGTARVDANELQSTLLDVGAIGTNARTFATHTSFHTVIPANQLSMMLWLEADRMANITDAIDAFDVGNEITTTIDEWDTRIAGEQFGNVSLSLYTIFFPAGHPHQRASPQQIRRLDEAHAHHALTRHYGPANATLVLVGNLPDDVSDQIDRYFGHLEGGNAPRLPSIDFAPLGERRRVLHPVDESSMGPQTVQVMMAWATPGIYEPGDAEADLLAAWLTIGGRLDVLAEAMLPAAMLTFNAYQMSFVGQSIFVIEAAINGPHDPLTIEALLDTMLEDIRERPPSREELTLAREFLVTQNLTRTQTIDRQAALAQFYIAHGKPPNWLEQDMARFDTVDERAMTDFIGTHLQRDRCAVVLTADAERVP